MGHLGVHVPLGLSPGSCHLFQTHPALTPVQVVVHENRILEKPGSVDEAHEYLEGYARAPACTVGSVLATDLASGREAEDVEWTTIHLRPLPADVCTQLVTQGDVFYCAGGLMVRGGGKERLLHCEENIRENKHVWTQTRVEAARRKGERR